MAKEVRLKLSENEKMGLANGLNVQSFNGDSIEELVEKENIRKFNDQVEQFQNKLDDNNSKFEKAQEDLSYDINKAEIKPVYSRILIKPLQINPFQQMEQIGGIITDTGGYTPHTQRNPMTGRIEEQEQVIKCGVVIEVGPEAKYLKEGDAVYYHTNTAVPVPFFKQGLVTVNENQILAVIAEGLEARFSK